MLNKLRDKLMPRPKKVKEPVVEIALDSEKQVEYTQENIHCGTCGRRLNEVKAKSDTANFCSIECFNKAN